MNYLGVSENGGTPKSSILIGFSIINHPFWGTTIFGNIHFVVNEKKTGAAFFQTHQTKMYVEQILSWLASMRIHVPPNANMLSAFLSHGNTVESEGSCGWKQNPSWICLRCLESKHHLKPIQEQIL